ncbi:hypothetical protein, partial [Erythrobacter sp. YJ-T3-07]|uniref:hypothetical protein n=1 Tax=Erythrobacter sp. YJ-T3-07 TaxID=2793063 RepID=UPI001F2A0390
VDPRGFDSLWLAVQARVFISFERLGLFRTRRGVPYFGWVLLGMAMLLNVLVVFYFAGSIDLGAVHVSFKERYDRH